MWVFFFFYWRQPQSPIPSLFLRNSGFLTQEIITEHLTYALIYYKVFEGLFLSLYSSVQPAPYYSYRLFLELLTYVVVSHTGICVVKHQQMQGKWFLKASVMEVTWSPLWDQVAGRQLYLGRSTWVGRGRESWKIKAGVGWTACSLQTWGSTIQVGGCRWFGAWLRRLSTPLAANLRRSPRSSKLFLQQGEEECY